MNGLLMFILRSFYQDRILFLIALNGVHSLVLSIVLIRFCKSFLLIVSASFVEVSFVGSEKFSVALDIDITCLINHSRCVWRGLSQRKERK